MSCPRCHRSCLVLCPSTRGNSLRCPLESTIQALWIATKSSSIGAMPANLRLSILRLEWLLYRWQRIGISTIPSLAPITRSKSKCAIKTCLQVPLSAKLDSSLFRMSRLSSQACKYSAESPMVTGCLWHQEALSSKDRKFASRVLLSIQAIAICSQRKSAGRTGM